MSDKEEVLQALLDAAHGEIGALKAENERLAAMAGERAVLVAGNYLTDEQITEIARAACADGRLSWLGFKKDQNDEYRIPVLSKSHFQLVHAALDIRATAAKSVEGMMCKPVTLEDFGGNQANFGALKEFNESAAPAKPEPAVVSVALTLTDEMETAFIDSLPKLGDFANHPNDVNKPDYESLWRDNNFQKAFDAMMAAAPVAQPLAPSGAVLTKKPLACSVLVQQGFLQTLKSNLEDMHRIALKGGASIEGGTINGCFEDIAQRTPGLVLALESVITQPLAGQDVLAVRDEFAQGIIAALGVLNAHGHPHGSTYHDEIVQSAGIDAIYAAAEDEDYEWAGLDPSRKPAAPSPVNPKQEQI